MITQYSNIHETKTNLSKLLQKMLRGEDIIIAKAGKPIARIIPYKEMLKPRKLGLWKGKVHVPANFNDEDEEINKLFYGE